MALGDISEGTCDAVIDPLGLTFECDNIAEENTGWCSVGNLFTEVPSDFQDGVKHAPIGFEGMLGFKGIHQVCLNPKDI